MSIPQHITALANTIALQADALATGKVPADQVYAHVQLMAHNADTLKAWTEDRTPQPISQHRVSHLFPPLDAEL